MSNASEQYTNLELYFLIRMQCSSVGYLWLPRNGIMCWLTFRSKLFHNLVLQPTLPKLCFLRKKTLCSVQFVCIRHLDNIEHYNWAIALHQQLQFLVYVRNGSLDQHWNNKLFHYNKQRSNKRITKLLDNSKHSLPLWCWWWSQHCNYEFNVLKLVFLLGFN